MRVRATLNVQITGVLRFGKPARHQPIVVRILFAMMVSASSVPMTIVAAVVGCVRKDAVSRLVALSQIALYSRNVMVVIVSTSAVRATENVFCSRGVALPFV